MEIILLERIEKLGGIGDVVTVKNGFARNYLLPNNKALRANDANRKLFEANRSKIEADNAARRRKRRVGQRIDEQGAGPAVVLDAQRQLRSADQRRRQRQPGRHRRSGEGRQR